MADFFKGLKQGIGKGVTTMSIKSKEMLDSNRVNSQISDIARLKHEALAELGMRVCAMLDEGKIQEKALKAARAAIAELDKDISKREQELARIHSEAQAALQKAE